MRTGRTLGDIAGNVGDAVCRSRKTADASPAKGNGAESNPQATTGAAMNLRTSASFEDRRPQPSVVFPASSEFAGDRSDDVARLSLRRGELDVDFGEPAQDERRLVDVCAGVGGPVLLFVDGDVGQPVEDPFDLDPALHPGERRTGAGVDTAAERDVLADVLAVELELVRVLEPVRDRGSPRPG